MQENVISSHPRPPKRETRWRLQKTCLFFLTIWYNFAFVIGEAPAPWLGLRFEPVLCHATDFGLVAEPLHLRSLFGGEVTRHSGLYNFTAVNFVAKYYAVNSSQKSLFCGLYMRCRSYSIISRTKWC